MKKFIQNLKKVFIKYPAVICVYFIVGYIVISGMDFYINFKNEYFSPVVVLSNFDTVLWMWGIAYLLLMVIKLREKLNYEKELQKQTQIEELQNAKNKTIQEVILTLRHEINNPLTIIYGYTRQLKKNQLEEQEMKNVVHIEIAAQRINSTLKQLSESQFYEIINSPVGDLIDIPSHKIN